MSYSHTSELPIYIRYADLRQLNVTKKIVESLAIESKYWLLNPQLILQQDEAEALIKVFSQNQTIPENIKKECVRLTGCNPQLQESALGHGLRVTLIAIFINRNFIKKNNYSYISDLFSLVVSAFMHDVGKQRPDIDKVIKTHGKLSPEQRKIMQLHPKVSREVTDHLMKSLHFSSMTDKERLMILQGIEWHHEQMDGNGYYQIPMQKIPAIARTISVADAFAALTAKRTYKTRFATDKAFEILRQETENPHKFDRICVQALQETRPDKNADYFFWQT